jgi:DNA polymerase I
VSLKDVRLHMVDSFEDAMALNDWYLSGPAQFGEMAVDTETEGLIPGRHKVRTVQVGDDRAGWCLSWTGWSGLFTDIMRRYNGTVLMHNAPFDWSMIKSMGHVIPWFQIQDTRVKAHILEPQMRTGLKYQAGRYVDPAAATAQKDLDAAIKKFGWGGVPLDYDKFWQYAALDPVLTFLLNRVLEAKLRERGDEAFEVENAVLSVLAKMMDNRVPVNVEYAREQHGKFMQYCDDMEAWCKREYGVSPGSNQAVVRVLQQAGFQFTKGTAAGAVALDKEVLEGVEHPLATAVLKRRQIQKLATTYLDHFIQESEDGLLRASLNSLGARTGRMSVSSPNMQNLPRVSEGISAANVVRNCVEAAPGHTLVFCDFAQVETRLLAHLSGDPGLIAAFHSSDDFFVTLARTVFADDSIDKKSPLRNVIKTLVYAKIYGAGLEKMAKTLGFTVAHMASVDNALRLAYPGIKRFQDETLRTIMKNLREFGEGFITCPLSGRRHFTDRGKEYAGVNYLIQGMAAFFFKKKLLELDAAGLGEWMILPVHDEIILHVPDDRVDEVGEILTKIMNDADAFTVPIEAEVSVGPRWGEKRGWVRAA